MRLRGVTKRKFRRQIEQEERRETYEQVTEATHAKAPSFGERPNQDRKADSSTSGVVRTDWDCAQQEATE